MGALQVPNSARLAFMHYCRELLALPGEQGPNYLGVLYAFLQDARDRGDMDALQMVLSVGAPASVSVRASASVSFRVCLCFCPPGCCPPRIAAIRRGACCAAATHTRKHSLSLCVQEVLGGREAAAALGIPPHHLATAHGANNASAAQPSGSADFDYPGGGSGGGHSLGDGGSDGGGGLGGGGPSSGGGFGFLHSPSAAPAANDSRKRAAAAALGAKVSRQRSSINV
jgi:uncharacterized membrane protein YgcG